jgi:polysaccharide biosynthesis transport protein
MNAMTDTSQPEEGNSGLVKAIPSILWQRRWMIGVPFVLISLGSVAAALLIPPTYRSEATVVIEAAQLPAELVPSSLNELVDQRLARVRQRVLSRPDLIQLIRTNSLYPEMSGEPFSEIIDKMRRATTVAPISASLDTNSWRGGGSNTIAFTISFDYEEALPAQVVVQQYVNRFLELDTDSRTESATNAAGFLQGQAGQLQRQIQLVEGRISQIKQANGPVLSLPTTLIDNPAAGAGQLDAQISQLTAQNAQLQAARQAQVDPEVTSLENSLRALSAKYSDDHPDVVQTRAQLDAAKKAAADRKASQPDQFAAQISANNAQIGQLRASKSLLLSQSSVAQQLRARAPAVIEEVAQLESRAEGLREQLAGISTKLQSAEISARMQADQKGERLAVADPATLPEEPVWPNRPLLIAGGVLGGLAVGLGLALLMELLFRPIRGTDELRRVTGRPPLVVIPDLARKPNLLVRFLERRSRRKLAARPAVAR